MDLDFPPLALPTLPGGETSIESMGPPKAISRRAKAAIVVRYLLNEGAEIALEDLPEDLQSILTHQMGAMRLVDKPTVHAALEEFTTELEAVGLSFPGGIAGALQVLDGKISPHTHSRLRKENGVRVSGNPWQRIQSMSAEKLAPIFETESFEISAVVLSKLDVSVAAEILSLLPGPHARQITFAVSKTTGVTPEAIDRIGMSLAAQLDAEPTEVFDEGPIQRIGAILNNSKTATRDDVLSGLEEADQNFANEVRKAIFTFANIPARVAARDVPVMLRGIDQDLMLNALAAAGKMGFEAVPEFIFANMSARLADSMKDEINDLGDIKASDGEEAMASVATKIREMEAKGDIMLLHEEEDEES